MKKIISGLFALIMFDRPLQAQVTIQPGIPLVGMIQKSQLWNVLVINSSATRYDCSMQLILRERITGLEVWSAITGQFTIEEGTKQLNETLLNPIQYNYVNTSAGNAYTGFVPAGSYTACFILSSITQEANLAEECVQFDTEPLSPPMLIFPSDSAELEIVSQFSWIPPTPEVMFDMLRYQVMITEIIPGQKAEEAIQENVPFYSDGHQLTTVFNYPGSSISFEKDKWYAWQVVARDEKSYAGKSEVWVFKVKPPSFIDMIVEQSPFIKMKKGDPEKGVAPNGILKISYVNETTDSTVTIRIIDQGTRQNEIAHFSIHLKPGENLVQHNLKKLFSLEDNRIYEAEIINSRKEKWVVQFVSRQYEIKKKN